MDSTTLSLAIQAEYETLRRIARSEVYVGTDPDDLFQAAVEKCLKGAAGFDGGNLGGWFRTVCRSVRHTDHRHNSRQTASVERARSLGHSWTQETAVEDEYDETDGHLIRLVAGALAALPETQQAAVRAVLIDGLKYREAAVLLGVPEATVKTWVRRGRQALAAALGDAEAA